MISLLKILFFGQRLKQVDGVVLLAAVQFDFVQRRLTCMAIILLVATAVQLITSKPSEVGK